MDAKSFTKPLQPTRWTTLASGTKESGCSMVMTPCRTEKVDFSKKLKKQKQKQNHQKNKSTGRITRRNKKKQEKTKKKKSKPAFSAVLIFFLIFFCFFFLFFFVFFLFFPWFWVSSLFFLFALVLFFFVFLFFCQTLYSLCCWTHNSRWPGTCAQPCGPLYGLRSMLSMFQRNIMKYPLHSFELSASIV
jgi:cation transport ATPase